MASFAEEFEAKLGQFIYTHVMYERLRKFLLEKASKAATTIRLSIGTDNEGNEVYLDVTVTKGSPTGTWRKRSTARLRRDVVITLTNERLVGSDIKSARELEHMVEEGLKWWHGYLRERDKLNLHEWHSSGVVAADCLSSRPVFLIPVESVVYPPSSFINIKEEQLDVLVGLIEVLGPIYVKQIDAQQYELIAGLPKLLACQRAGREYVDAYILEPGNVSEVDIYQLNEATANLMNVIERACKREETSV